MGIKTSNIFIDSFKVKNHLILFLVAGITVGCASGHCRGRPPVPEKIKVYKADGSVQCSKKPGTQVDKMAEELKGLEIFSQENKHDGQMHITLCGSPTGKINVFEIKKSDLEKALTLGFKEWK